MPLVGFLVRLVGSVVPAFGASVSIVGIVDSVMPPSVVEPEEPLALVVRSTSECESVLSVGAEVLDGCAGSLVDLSIELGVETEEIPKPELVDASFDPRVVAEVSLSPLGVALGPEPEPVLA